ncbi:MAG: hypothetical protein ACYDEX_10110 [Mobilitalea sp.]
MNNSDGNGIMCGKDLGCGEDLGCGLRISDGGRTQAPKCDFVSSTSERNRSSLGRHGRASCLPDSNNCTPMFCITKYIFRYFCTPAIRNSQGYIYVDLMIM